MAWICGRAFRSGTNHIERICSPVSPSYAVVQITSCVNPASVPVGVGTTFSICMHVCVSTPKAINNQWHHVMI